MKNLIDELFEAGVATSKRHLSALLGRSPNYICEVGGFRAEDLVHLRLHLIAVGAPYRLVQTVEQMLLEPWRDIG